MELIHQRPFESSLEFAVQEDALDPLAHFKNRFYFPTHEHRDAIYFCGNSLGLQPKHLSAAIETELKSWRELAVGGYFGGTNPWLNYQEKLLPALSHIMGAGTHELTIMNSLTVNLHLLMLSFYKPDAKRFRILMEAGAFPSDQYAVETLVKHYGLDPEACIIEIQPEPGKKTLSTDQILAVMETHAESLSMLIMGGMNYYTGQLFDMKAISAKAHQIGAIAGFDLAHVAGNIPTQLHDWDVDFAVWCSYKYLNAGPGAVGGVFIHERWASEKILQDSEVGGETRNLPDLKWKKDLYPKPMPPAGT